MRAVLGHRAVAAGVVLAALATAPAHADDAARLEHFETRIRPVLIEHCYRCHNSTTMTEAGFALDARDGIREAIVPGDPEASVLFRALNHADGAPAMPAEGPQLDATIIADFERWIRDGAFDPRDEPPTATALAEATAWPVLLERRKSWWSLQPVADVEPPPASGWSAHPIDRFIESGWRERGLSPAGPADRRTLIRRLSYALTGLPPTIEEVRAFVADDRAGAFDRLVDRLLASPAYGERWARHWMDVVRYADSHGSEGDPAIPHAYEFRDYLIRAFNEDVPFDQLVREHIAGDLLSEPRINHELGINESAIGVAHWRLVFHGFAPTDALDERVRFTDDQINVFGKAFQGLTISCARCHDHKFDAIGQDDYYALYGVITSCRPVMQDVNTRERQVSGRATLQMLKDEIRLVLARDWRDALPALRESLVSGDAVPGETTPAHPLHPLVEVRRLANDGVSFHEAWRQLAVTEHADRLAFENDRTADIAAWNLGRADHAAAWFADGNGLVETHHAPGVFTIAAAGPSIVTAVLPAGVYTHSLSTRHRGVFSSPDIDLTQDLDVWFRIAGDGGATVRYVVQHYPRSGTVYPIDDINGGAWRWHHRDLSYWTGDTAHLELATAHDMPLEVRGRDRSWFGARSVHLRPHGAAQPRDAQWAIHGGLFGGDAPPDRDALVDRLVERLADAVDAWAAGEATDGQALALDAWLRAGLLPNTIDALPHLATSVQAYRDVEATIPAPTRVPGIVDAQIVAQPLYDRGDHRAPLDAVPRRYLAAFGFGEYPAGVSGRLQLARDIVDPRNPLTARVIVNRIWVHLFGRGIVATPDNFGRLGSTPSHPALLDHLAARMVEHDWSIKQMIRYIVSSRTWQLDSRASPAAREIDPDNEGLSHANVRRLDAESIRDGIVFVAGRLDSARGGPGFAANRGGTRRSVYITSRRNALDAFLGVFDAPVPYAPVGRRMQTNVPAQALAMMNDPFVIDLARSWGELARVRDDLSTDRSRIAMMFEQALARAPTTAELDTLTEYARTSARQLEQTMHEHRALEERAAAIESELDELLGPTSARLNEERGHVDDASRGPDPIARWAFAEGLEDTLGTLHTTLHGSACLAEDGLVLDGNGYAATVPIEEPLDERTLEAWVRLDTLDQRGGGVVSIQHLDGRIFDAIVFGERVPRRWMAGSNNFSRTRDFGAFDECTTDEPVHIAIAYEPDGTVRGYRNGAPYGKPYTTGSPPRFAAGGGQLLFGLRHGAATGNRLLRGTIVEARLYDRALDADEIAASADAWVFVRRRDVIAALEPDARRTVAQLDEQLASARAQLESLGEPAPSTETWTRVAHAIFNLKEFIYLR